MPIGERRAQAAGKVNCCRMRKGVRKKSISKIIAFASIAFAAAVSTPCYARVIHRHPTASKALPEAPAVPLTSIHVLGDRPAPFALNAKAAMMIDADTGTVLYSYNEHQKMQPASLAKIMTFYLSLDAMKNGKLAPATEVTISEKAWRLSMDDTVSRMFLSVGQKVPGQRSAVRSDGVVGQRRGRGARGIYRRQHRRVHGDDERQGEGNRTAGDSLCQPRRIAGGRRVHHRGRHGRAWAFARAASS